MFFDNVEVLQYIGNRKANRYFEARIHGSGGKPNQHSSMPQRKAFIYNKYLKLMWANKAGANPAKIFQENRKKGILPDRM